MCLLLPPLVKKNSDDRRKHKTVTANSVITPGAAPLVAASAHSYPTAAYRPHTSTQMDRKRGWPVGGREKTSRVKEKRWRNVN